MTTPSTVASWTRGAIAGLISSYVASSALLAAREIGLLDGPQTGGFVDTATICEGGRHAGRHTVATLSASLVWAGVVDIEGSMVRPRPLLPAGMRTGGRARQQATVPVPGRGQRKEG